MKSISLPVPQTSYVSIAVPSSQQQMAAPDTQPVGFVDVEYIEPDVIASRDIDVNSGFIGSMLVTNDGFQAGTGTRQIVVTGEQDEEKMTIGDPLNPNVIVGQLFSKSGVDEYGIWCTVGYFSGTITATTGHIGAWTINATTITSAGVTLDSAGNIRFGKSSFADTTNAGLIMGMNGATPTFYFGTAADASYMKLVGGVYDLVGTISNRSTLTIASSINSSGNLITDVVNGRIDSSAKKILADFNFGTTDYAGAVNSGNVTWNTTTGAITGGSGVIVYRGGIIGVKAGVATFTISSATGDATFAGTLSAPTGSLGALTVLGPLSISTGGNLKSGQTAYNTGTGWFFEYNGGTPRFSVGDGTTENSITFDGATLNGSGSIRNLVTLTAGEAIAQYDVVRIYTDGKVYKASSIVSGWANLTTAFAPSAVAANASGKFQLDQNFTMTGLSAGNIYYVTDGTIDRQYSTNNDVSNVHSGATIIAESFTTGSSVVKIDWVEVFGKLIGTGCGNLHFDLYATSGGVPTGAALASTEDIDTSTFSTTDAWHIFRFVVPKALSSSTKYAIRAVPSGGNAGNNFGWRRGNTSYTGSAWLTNSGSWSEDTTKNMMFRTAYTAGTISTTAGTITKKIGISLSSTSLYIMNS